MTGSPAEALFFLQLLPQESPFVSADGAIDEEGRGFEGISDGFTEGAAEGDGIADGMTEGSFDGLAEGSADGDGFVEGSAGGSVEGSTEGATSPVIVKKTVTEASVWFLVFGADTIIV